MRAQVATQPRHAPEPGDEAAEQPAEQHRAQQQRAVRHARLHEIEIESDAFGVQRTEQRAEDDEHQNEERSGQAHASVWSLSR